MKVLISGGAGFIGSNLAVALSKRGDEVTILDNLSPQIHGNNNAFNLHRDNKFRLIIGDVRDRDTWIEALEGQDAVVHLAAETGTGQSMYQIDRYVDINIRGTALLFDIISNARHSLKKIVVASSRAIYGEGKYRCQDHGVVYPLGRSKTDMELGDFLVKCPKCGRNAEVLPTTEDSVIHPSSIYGITKQNQEQIGMNIGAALGIPVVSLRYQNVYGPGQSLINPYTGIISIFSTRIRASNEINIFEDGQEARDFVFIDDVVCGTVAAIDLKSSGQHVVNIGSGIPISVITVVQTLKEAFGSNVAVRISGNYRVGDIRNNFADLTKARDLLGFEPKTYFRDGILRFVEWVNRQVQNSDSFDASIIEMRSRGLLK